MEVGRFLRLAMGIIVALGKLHQRGLVHKDIKPANILVNAKREAMPNPVSRASLVAPRERQSPHPPETIAGTLAYMAPEQTGRMNRSIDSRSDLYALGVTFYQMLTGALPFTAADPMEWLHCHLARRPVAPAELLKEIPSALELVLVSGYSGIGKSSVVNELQPVLVPPRGLFASGKFDQYKRDIPYSTLAQGLSDACPAAARQKRSGPCVLARRVAGCARTERRTDRGPRS
jgi:serine/threonine protein kinase